MKKKSDSRSKVFLIILFYTYFHHFTEARSCNLVKKLFKIGPFLLEIIIPQGVVTSRRCNFVTSSDWSIQTFMNHILDKNESFSNFYIKKLKKLSSIHGWRRTQFSITLETGNRKKLISRTATGCTIFVKPNLNNTGDIFINFVPWNHSAKMTRRRNPPNTYIIYVITIFSCCSIKVNVNISYYRVNF